MYIDVFVDHNTKVEIGVRAAKIIGDNWMVNLFAPNDLAEGKDWAFLAATLQRLAVLCGEKAASCD